jgi:hypothetical protein
VTRAVLSQFLPARVYLHMQIIAFIFCFVKALTTCQIRETGYSGGKLTDKSHIPFFHLGTDGTVNEIEIQWRLPLVQEEPAVASGLDGPWTAYSDAILLWKASYYSAMVLRGALAPGCMHQPNSLQPVKRQAPFMVHADFRQARRFESYFLRDSLPRRTPEEAYCFSLFIERAPHSRVVQENPYMISPLSLEEAVRLHTSSKPIPI